MKTMAAVGVMLAFGLMAGPASAQSGDPARGEGVFNQQCKACHTVAKDGANVVGPNLFGLFGRKAGVAKGFTASEAMTKSGIAWDEKTLADYLKDPKGRVPGTKMVYVGLKRAEQLDDVVAYLKKATQ